jgi:multisubunit Na+/H+ antiporter MnhC subunit
MNEMYRKMGYVRNYMFVAFGLIGISTYVYVKKNKRKNVLGTELH